MSERLHGMVVSAVVKVARDKLVAALGDPAVTNTMRGNMVSELHEMKDEMESILAVLEDAERRSIRDEPLVRWWLQRVEPVAYDIWDIVDEIRTNKDPAAPLAARMLPLSVSSISRPNKISVIRQELHNIRKEQFQLNWGQHFDVPYFSHRETTSDLPEARVVGRDEQVERILDFLLSPAAAAGMSDDGIREWPFFLPIFGLAGVGKTTLAKLVYNHPRSQHYYDHMVWVYVSPWFDLRRIGIDIIEGLTLARYDGEEDSINAVLDDLDSIKRRIHERVGDGKKVLVVLDDIWEQDQQELDRFKSLLGVGNRAGSWKAIVNVIVTTCDEDIARRLCSNKVQPYKVHPLSDDQCWEVIKQACRLELKINQQELGKIGREIIATKCGGLPLAAQVLGFILWKIDDYQGWLKIASTDDWDGFLFHEGIRISLFSTLSLSYQSMPPNLRLCFAYLGTLPERQNMAEDDIIHRWMALGLIEPTNGISTGQQIISRLLDISFLEHSNLASTRRKHDDKGMISFSMHSLIHDFARSLMSSTLVVANGEHTRDPGRRRCRCAVLTNFDLVPSKLSGMLPAELRSLSLLGCSKMELSNDSFSFAKYLRVLELREPSMQKLPDSIGQVRLLGYLNLSGCSGLVQLPESFGNLTSVVHVNLSGCSGLVQLPESFGNLTSVVHVNLLGCSGLVKLPESFGKLTSVLHINLSGCSGLKSLPKSFSNLTSVVHINLSGCHRLDDLPKSFGLLKKLEHLDLSSCSCLEGIPSVVDCLTNLQHLNLSHPCCYIAQHRYHLRRLKDVLGNLKNLRYLNLSMCLNPILCYLPEKERDEYVGCISGLHSLEHLDLSHNIFLFDIPRSLGQLSQLQTLNLFGCARLKKIDKWMGEKKLLGVSNCLGLERYKFVVHTDGGANCSNLSQLKDVSCKELEISCLEKVISTKEAQSIRWTEKKKLQKLTLVWSASFNDHQALLTVLVPPQNLQCFELHGYSSECLPPWLTSRLSSHLPNLVEVSMVDIPSCSNLPPFGVLPSLQRLILRRVDKVTRIDAGCLSGDSKAAFHRLLHVTLDGMVNLEEFNNCSSSDELVMFPTLDELVINKCPKLRFGDSPPKARMLVISDCEQLMSSLVKRGEHVEDPSSSTSTAITCAQVTEVVIESCKVPLDELKWSLLQGLEPLHSLHIRNCSEKIISPDIMKEHLSSLKLLCFSHCDNMTNLPEHVVQDTSLQELLIHGCRGIKSLPQSICEEKKKHYPHLRIRQCPELEKWCDGLEENKRKIALEHIIFEGESSSSEAGTSAKHTSD